MEPMKRSPKLTQFLETTVGRTTAITTNHCVKTPFGCAREISIGEIETWDKETIEEYRISGMCKTCQDNFYVEPEDKESLNAN